MGLALSAGWISCPAAGRLCATSSEQEMDLPKETDNVSESGDSFEIR